MSLALAMGVVVGTITGIIPGLHVNLAVFLIISFDAPGALDPYFWSVFIVSMAVTHSYLDFIPAIFLGVPTGDTAVVVFPGHRLLLEGKGPEAFRAAQAGGIAASVFATCFALFFLYYEGLLEIIEQALRPYLGYLLGICLLWFVWREIPKRKEAPSLTDVFRSIATSLIALMMIAQLSDIVFSSALAPADTGMMASFSGLFGISLILIALRESSTTVELPHQSPAPIKVMELVRRWWSGLIGSIGGIVVGLLPGLGVGEVSALLAGSSDKNNSRTSEDADKKYISTVGAVGTADAIISIAALFLIANSRSGASIGIEKLLGRSLGNNSVRNEDIFLLIVSAGFLAGIASLFTGQIVANNVSKYLNKINYRGLMQSIVVGLAIFTIVGGGVYAFLILICATLIGLFVMMSRIRPSTMMAFLIIPTTSFFLGINIPLFPLFKSPILAVWGPPEANIIGVGLAAGTLSAILAYVITSKMKK